MVAAKYGKCGVCHNNVYRIFKMAYQGMGPFAKYCVPV